MDLTSSNSRDVTAHSTGQIVIKLKSKAKSPVDWLNFIVQQAETHDFLMNLKMLQVHRFFFFSVNHFK